MPNENEPVCACSVFIVDEADEEDSPKLAIFVPRSRDGRNSNGRNPKSRNANGRISNGRNSGSKNSNGRNSDSRNLDCRNLDCRNSDGRIADGRNADGRNAEGRNTDGRNSDVRNSDGRNSNGRNSNGKSTRKQQDEARAPKSRTSSETGSSSTVMELKIRNSIQEILNHSRRTRSADRAESHYTYIDSGSSILGDGIREDAITEALYATIPDTPSASTNEIVPSQLSSQSRSQPLYAIPSMTSPPPTYDVAIAKTRSSAGLPPTYDEYLYHKARSHTPPPPWSDSIPVTSSSSSTTTSSSSSNPISSTQLRRELSVDEPELHDRVAQLTIAQAAALRLHQREPHFQTSREPLSPSTQQFTREAQLRAHQRARAAMTARSQSANRLQQQRITAMYDDAAFCMETTALQSAFDQGFAVCNLM